MTEPDELAGIDQLRAALAEPGPPISRLIGMTVVALEVGRVAFELTPAEDHLNPIGTVHGGIAATMLDSAMGCAVHSVLPPGVRYTTLDLHVHYLRAMTPETGAVRAVGTVVHLGGRAATAEARLVRATDEALLAHGTTTCLVMR